jgi:hypothetical protein
MYETTIPPFIDPARLLEVVRGILNSHSAEIMDTAHMLLYGGLGAIEGRNSIHRLSGLARSEGQVRAWSVVVKKIAAPKSGSPTADPAHPDYWQREALTFGSGLLDTLPKGFAAPRCFEIAENDDGLCLWLEDIVEPSDLPWPIARFGLAARHLGRFNGQFLDGRTLPNDAWLNRNLLRTRADRNAGFWSNLEAVRELPLFRRGWPEDLAVHALRLFQERHGLLDLLERLPRTVRHGDADRRNLLARNRGSTSESIAIDWAYTGIGPVGEEVAPLVVSSVMWFKGVAPRDLSDLDAIAFDGYIEGLRDSGWHGDPRLVRLACTATMALRYGPLSGLVGLVTMAAEQRAQAEQMLGRTVEEFLDQYAEVQRFAFDRADEARRLKQSV